MALLECVYCGIDFLPDKHGEAGDGCEVPRPLESSPSCRKITVCSCMCCSHCFNVLVGAFYGGCKMLQKADLDTEEPGKGDQHASEDEASTLLQNTRKMVLKESKSNDRAKSEKPPSLERIDEEVPYYSQLEDLFASSSEDASQFVVTHVESPDNLFLRPLRLDSEWIAFDARVGKMLSDSPVCATDLRVGDSVGVRYSYHWHRATILSEEGESACVRLVDVGKVVSVSVKTLKPLPLDLRTHKSFCHCVKLAHVLPTGSSPASWSITAKEKLASFISEFSDVWIKLTDQWEESADGSLKALVTIWVKETYAPGPFAPLRSRFVDVAGWMCENGLAYRPQYYKNLAETIRPFRESEDSKSDVDNANTVASDVADVPEDVLTDYEPPRVPMENDFEGTVTYIDQEGQIYVLPDENEGTLRAMEDEMTTVCESKSVFSGKVWKVGDNLLAKYPTDSKDGWYRAKVTDIGFDESDQRVLKVLFIDYGEQKMVFPSRGECCGDVPQAILRMPILVVRCKLANVVPVQGRYPIAFLDSVHQTLVDKRVHVRRTNTRIAFPMKVVVHLLVEPIVNIARMFVKLGMSRLIEHKDEWTNAAAIEREETLAGHIQPAGYLAQGEGSPSEDQAEEEKITQVFERGMKRFTNRFYR